MRRLRSRRVLAVVLCALMVAPTGAGVDLGPDRTEPMRLVVLFEDAPPDDLAEQLGDAGTVQLTDARLGFATVSTHHPDAPERLRALPGAVAVQPVHTYVPASGSDDPLASEQWGLDAINITPAWDRTQGSHDVKVAVLDYGAYRAHPDLRANTELGDPVACGPDANLREPGPPVDVFGHGTHVAGTVAAALDNGEGVAGMGNSCLMIVKICGWFCLGPHIALGIVHAAAHGADVVSMSLTKSISPLAGTPYQDLLVRRAIDHAVSEGVLLVAAAGNHGCSGNEFVGFPARHPDVMAVAALDDPDEIWTNSACGSTLEIAAPGGDVLSTLPPQVETPLSAPGGEPPELDPSPVAAGSLLCPTACYGEISGTSMATPHVSGIAALVLDANPSLSATQVRCLLDATADDLGPPGWDERFGHGRLDAGQAVAAADDPAAVGC